MKVAISQKDAVHFQWQYTVHQRLLEAVLVYALNFCLVMCDVKGEGGEEGPGGKLGAPVSVIQLLLFYCYCSTPLPEFISSVHHLFLSPREKWEYLDHKDTMDRL